MSGFHLGKNTGIDILGSHNLYLKCPIFTLFHYSIHSFWYYKWQELHADPGISTHRKLTETSKLSS